MSLFINCILESLLTILMLFTLTAYSQPLCIPDALGVPAAPGPPVWIDADHDAIFPEEPTEYDRIDDPRWRGALSLNPTTVTSSATDQLQFRALHSDDRLYFSWHLKVTPGTDDDRDKLWVGFRTSETEATVLEFTPYSQTDPAPTIPVPVRAQFPLEIKTFLTINDGSTWQRWSRSPTSGFSTPNWVNDETRVWLEEKSPGSGNYEWAVHMVVPIKTSGASLDDGLVLSDQFKMWFEFLVHIPRTAPLPPSLVYYNWPEGLSTETLPADNFPTPSTWDDFCRVSSCTDGCRQGVSITSADVGIKNLGGGMPTNTISLNTTNNFIARPLNNSGSLIPTDALEARFRIANWGSQPDWNNVTDPSLLWNDVDPDDPSGSSAASNGADIFNTDKGEIVYSWTPDATDRAQYQPECPVPPDGTVDLTKKRCHQCILVELSGPPGVIIYPSSVYRNMEIVNASMFRRLADISVVGIGADALNRPLRDLYIYVEALNMPKKAKQGKGDKSDLTKTRRDPYKNVTIGRMDVSFDSIASWMPTYVIHVYRDTGRRITRNDQDYPVLVPQTSFGYFIKHEGDLEGWRHELTSPYAEGNDGRLEKISKNVYKISIPNDGIAIVATEIETIEPWRIPRWLFWLIIIIFIIGILFVLSKKVFRAGPAVA